MSLDVLPITLPEGRGAINVYDIGAVLPDTSAPKKRSVIYTGLFPSGISVEGNSDKLIGMWLAALEDPDDDEDDLEDDADD